jgi:DNA-binding beta-propeller fold protein YncE
VFVAERDNHRIQKFDSNGTFLLKWGSVGGGDGQFRKPSGVVVDPIGNVFVADRDNHRVQKFCCEVPTAVEATAWGQVKRAYR